MQLLQQLTNALTQGSIYALIALGYTMVYGVLRLINFAHGDVYMLGAFFGLFISRATGALLLSQGGQSVPLWMTAAVFAGAMLGSALVGVLIERFAYRPLRAAPRLTALITAIGVSLLLEYGSQFLFSPDPQPFAQRLLPSTNLVQTPAFTLSFVKVFIWFAAAVLMLALNFLIQKTKIGRAMRAVALDRGAAQLMGIPTDRIIAFTFALGSALAASAGVLSAINQPQIDPLMGVQVGLRAFVAAVLGGIGNIYGAVLGGMLMAFAETATVVAGFSQFRDAVTFSILILVLVMRPAGLLGRNVAEKV